MKAWSLLVGTLERRHIEPPLLVLFFYSNVEVPRVQFYPICNVAVVIGGIPSEEPKWRGEGRRTRSIERVEGVDTFLRHVEDRLLCYSPPFLFREAGATSM